MDLLNVQMWAARCEQIPSCEAGQFIHNIQNDAPHSFRFYALLSNNSW